MERAQPDKAKGSSPCCPF